jgi:hypothetical protein
MTMSGWYCFKCNEELKEEDLMMMYLDVMRFMPGLKCKKCGAMYLTEKTVQEVINPGCQEIDAKMG